MSINNSFFHNSANGFNPPPAGNGVSQALPAAVQNSNQIVQQNQLTNELKNITVKIEPIIKELTNFTPQQNINMVKDLFQFPKQFDQLILKLLTDLKLNNQQSAVLMLTSNINLTELSKLLQNSSKEANLNLHKLLANFNQIGVNIKNEQIESLTKLISFVATASHSDIQSLKTVMLMYLPWLPLSDPNAFKLEIAAKSNSDCISDAIDSVGVLISTKNYGNFQSQILKTEEDGIKIEAISSETFPLKQFVELMKKESKNYSININFDLAKKEAFNKEKVEKTQTEVFLNTSPGVNPFLLLISNILIRNVHEIDINTGKNGKS